MYEEIFSGEKIVSLHLDDESSESPFSWRKRCLSSCVLHGNESMVEKYNGLGRID